MCLVSLLLLTGCLCGRLHGRLFGLIFWMKDNSPTIQSYLLGLNNIAQHIEGIFATGVAGAPAKDACQIVAWPKNCGLRKMGKQDRRYLHVTHLYPVVQ